MVPIMKYIFLCTREVFRPEIVEELDCVMGTDEKIS